MVSLFFSLYVTGIVCSFMEENNELYSKSSQPAEQLTPLITDYFFRQLLTSEEFFQHVQILKMKTRLRTLLKMEWK